MNYFSPNKLLYWIIAALGIFCFALLAGGYLHYRKEKKFYEERVKMDQKRRMEIIERMQFTPGQKAEFTRFRNAYFA